MYERLKIAIERTANYSLYSSRAVWMYCRKNDEESAANYSAGVLSIENEYYSNINGL